MPKIAVIAIFIAGITVGAYFALQESTFFSSSNAATEKPLISPTEAEYGAWAVYFVDLRADALAAEALLSGDEYLFLRDAYLQRRTYLIQDGEVEEEDPFLDDF